MPPKSKRGTRASAKVESDEETEDTKPMKNDLVELDPQRVFYIPDGALESLSSPEGLKVVSHPHPRTKTPMLFVMCENKLFEITSHSTTEGFCSFFIDQTVEKDGKIYTVTPFDVRFLALEALRLTEKFVELSNYFEGEVLSAVEGADFESLFDIKEVCDRRLMRYNEEKVISWLEAKVRRVAKALASENISCGAVARSKILKEENTENTQDYLHSAAGILREYISEPVSAKLERHLGIERKKPLKESANDLEGSLEESKPKRRKTEEPTEDYSKGATSSAEDKKTPAKLTPAQKKLAQCDKTGMKSIASFFSKAK
ncbi:ribonuclease H2 subunit B [Galendromus occidentalis]|uniref:Ribonuclease H2 subunit B n=1 Tax=Galendromus occidentalis TaxID=34638 RepID=A0AAJ6VW91_9ACAR|nr:ribonuclease H2 subunit B [Galendromus occidentalis]